jgi:predicted HicB family RNase H-like nuclease
MSETNREIYRVAHELFSRKPDWVTFFREVLGIGGIIRQTYKTPADLAEFEQTPEYIEIQQMLARLRGNANTAEYLEPTRVITVRLPQSMHEALRVEAHEHRTSMNKLCISKLLQVVDEQLVPAESYSSTSNGSAATSNVPATVEG